MTGAGGTELLQLDRLALQQCRHHIARLDHSDNILDRAIGDGDLAVRCFEQRLFDLVRRSRAVDPVDFRPRGHHLPHRAIGQAHDFGDHRPLVFLEYAGGLRLGDHEMQFLRGDLVPGVAVEAEQLEDHRTGAVE